MSFDRELVVLLTKPSMFGNLEVHALEVRSREGLNKQHSKSVH